MNLLLVMMFPSGLAGNCPQMQKTEGQRLVIKKKKTNNMGRSSCHDCCCILQNVAFLLSSLLSPSAHPAVRRPWRDC